MSRNKIGIRRRLSRLNEECIFQLTFLSMKAFPSLHSCSLNINNGSVMMVLALTIQCALENILDITVNECNSINNQVESFIYNFAWHEKSKNS